MSYKVITEVVKDMWKEWRFWVVPICDSSNENEMHATRREQRSKAFKAATFITQMELPQLNQMFFVILCLDAFDWYSVTAQKVIFVFFVEMLLYCFWALRCRIHIDSRLLLLYFCVLLDIGKGSCRFRECGRLEEREGTYMKTCLCRLIWSM